MEISNSYRFNVPPAVVWQLLNDPSVIASCLSGCDQLVPVGGDCFRVELAATIAAVSGRYAGTVTILDKRPPNSYRLVVEASGKTGFVRGEAIFEIVGENGDTNASVAVNGHGEVGGLIARVGQRLLGSVSKMMMDRFFACLQVKSSATSQAPRRASPDPEGGPK